MVIARLNGIPIGNLNHPNFRTSDCADADFSFSNIEKADFVDADLSRCVFESVSFKDCELSRSRLDNCSFDNAELQRCEITGASLKNSRFTKTVMYESNFSWADLSESQLVHCEITKCKFSNSVGHATRMEGCSCNNLDMSLLHAPNLRCTGTTFTECSFEKSVLEATFWAECNFSATSFRGANVQGAQFQDSCKGQVLQGISAH
jgi:uncharacterized protein YjbI with pentapeptide repeats